MPRNSKRSKRGRRNRSRRDPNGEGVVRDSFAPKFKFRSAPDPGPEFKFLDYSATALAISNGGSTSVINTGTSGTGAIGNRIGQKLIMKHIAVRGFCYNTVANLTAAGLFLGGSDVIRVALVYDKQSNATTANYNDIYNSGAGSAITPVTMRTVSNLDRFLILAEKTVMICATSNTLHLFDFEINCDLETRYNTGNAGTAADINTGGLLLVWADMNGGASQSSITWVSRVSFLDS